VKGEVGGNFLRPEGTGIFSFVHQLDSSHPHVVVIEVEFLGIVDGVSDLDTVSYIGRGDFIDGSFKADGGIVIDDPFMSDEEDLIQFGPGQSSDGDPVDGGIVAVERSFSDAGVELMVVVVLEPQPEGFIEFIQSDILLDA
jgi:hypothetical protein